MGNVAAVVVVYNGMRRNWIEKCLGSLLNSSIPIDVFAVDNGSTDGSIDYISTHYPHIDFTVSKENLGFGNANNVGIKRALDKGARHVFLLNQDAWVDVDTVDQLVSQQTKYPEYGILSPIHCNGDGDALDARFMDYISPRKGCNLLSDLLVIDRQISKIYAVEFVNAAAWLLSKECLLRTGGFGPMFYHYGEDVNYCQRVHYGGLKVGVYPVVKIYHDRLNSSQNKYYSQLEREKRSLRIKMYNPNDTLSWQTAFGFSCYYALRNLFRLSLLATIEHIVNGCRIIAKRKQVAFEQKKIKRGEPFKYLT